MDSSAESQLHCSYTDPKELSPFMILQPLKKEQVSLNPIVTVFYEVISDQEIEILKSIAQPKVHILSFTNLSRHLYKYYFQFSSFKRVRIQARIQES